MKRNDRLIAIVIALQQRSETAQSLAAKFEVSKRTILRDMQSLSEMGIPLYSVTGPAGGFRLMDGFRLPPLQLDSQEALTVLFALRAMTKMADTPFNQARWTVMDKITAVLPEQTLRQIDPVLRHVEVNVPERKIKSPLLPALMEYTANSRWLRVLYRSENHRRSLQLKPERVYTAYGFWYCEAYSVAHEEKRTFRVDRFEQIETIDKPESEENRSKSGTHVSPKKDKPQTSTRIVAKLSYRGALRVEQDEHIGELVKQRSDEEWEIDFMCPPSEIEWAVRFFFMLGLDASVISPPSLRSAIHRLASEVCTRYKTEVGDGT
ncbi:helix-turn-helix transcriptional regulator [Paenibacillus allorhizosphaerae]|uniref:YafY family transcriptional regulator n=1 Tax=Paenibacillus allorhizosphaerae TaxID=2849866 RepID=A0ABN7TKY3_9BACL|nr:YafY family protein [Paenibacillus allorhizosphaerae]CAG7633865.1 hypothetical protein PAECIP111802_01990 [Paenibacillus allorhizosphaerae]